MAKDNPRRNSTPHNNNPNRPSFPWGLWQRTTRRIDAETVEHQETRTRPCWYSAHARVTAAPEQVICVDKQLFRLETQKGHPRNNQRLIPVIPGTSSWVCTHVGPCPCCKEGNTQIRVWQEKSRQPQTAVLEGDALQKAFEMIAHKEVEA